MTLADLITLFREEAFDSLPGYIPVVGVPAPYQWSDSILKLYANEAQIEACRRADLLLDSASSFCKPVFTSGEPIIPLDPRIVDVKRIRDVSQYVQLQPISALEMDRKRPGWEMHTGTIPLCVVTEYQTNALRLYPIPMRDGELTMTVQRLPLADMVADTDTPEIRPEYHPALVQWMLYRAYSKQDTETCDPAKAEKALAKFTQEFGEARSARNETWRRNRVETHIDPIA